MTTPLLANLICGSPARNHDFDFARMRLAQALYEAGDIRTDAFNDYDNAEAIAAADLLVTYTSQVPVGDEQCRALRDFLERGGRWFAIHASNSVRDNVQLPVMLGSKFITHPPYTHFTVSVAQPEHPLLKGIESFEVDDELYVIEHGDEIEVLLYTRWGGEALGGRLVPEDERPLMYLKQTGEGAVFYLALGHCNRPFDSARPGQLQPDRRGPWELPVYKELIRRGIAWAANRSPAGE
jgi:type 1 glutamine amidotransferase